MNWSERPMLRLLLFLVLGIVISGFFPDGNEWYYILSCFFIILFAVMVVAVHMRISYAYRWGIGIVIGLLFTIIGVFLVKSQTQNIPKFTTTHPTALLVNVIDNPTVTQQTVKAVVEIKGSESDTLNMLKTIRVLVYFEKSLQSHDIIYGDDLIVSGVLKTPTKPLNPLEFDYGKYLERGKIHYVTYVKTGCWEKVGYSPANYIIAFAGKLRQKLLSLLAENGMDKDDYSVAAAIILGYDDTMEQNIRQNYVRAGAMHILCVSGLHVGIIFLVVNFLLGISLRGVKTEIPKAILLLLTIWFYAVITGLSPSVQRAAIMLSVIIIGNLIKRNKDTYNSIAASALLLLISDPMLIYNIGFQLSYAAVAGIVTFQKPLYNMFYIKNMFLDKIWEITALAFSAQLATFPLAIYYFHFFPSWFWLTNLFTFPLSFAIIIAGFVFMILSWIPVAGVAAGTIVAGLIYILNLLIDAVKYLPYSGIDGVYFSIPMLIVVYLFVISVFMVLFARKYNHIKYVVVLILLIIGINFYHTKVDNNPSIAVFSVRNHMVLAAITEDKSIIISDTLVTNDCSILEYNLKNYFSKRGIALSENIVSVDKNCDDNIFYLKDNILLFRDVRVLINNASTYCNKTNSVLFVDYVIFSGKKFKKIEELSKTYVFSKLIIDSSVPYYLQKKILSQAKEYGVDCYNVNTRGAFIIEL